MSQSAGPALSERDETRRQADIRPHETGEGCVVQVDRYVCREPASLYVSDVLFSRPLSS